MTRRRIGNIGIISLLLITVLAGCGGGSDSAPTATTIAVENVAPTATTVVMADNVEPTGEAPGDVIIPTNPPDDEVMPTSTLYAVDKPTPTPLASAICSFGNTNRLIFQSFEEKRGELHVCNAKFAWPEGYEIDVEKLAFRGDTSTGGEVGVARTTIAVINTCAWMTYWQESTEAGDQGSADNALTYMLTILPYWNSQDVSDPSTIDTIFAEPARLADLGDPSMMIQFANGDACATFRDVRVDP